MRDAGFRLVAGVDEVGRGALAGPLVAAAVILPWERFCAADEPTGEWDRVVDSKLLPPNERQRLSRLIGETALAVGFGTIEADEIDAIGLAAANRLAMERAVSMLPMQPDALLLDAVVTDLGLPQVGLIDGDACCLSIAAASIVAKVLRDRLMEACHTKDSRYSFHRHKGYGTAVHLEAIERYGPCWLHRRSFAPVRQYTSALPS